MSKILVSIVLILISINFDSGSGTAYLKCKSDSGRTTFYAELQDIEVSLNKAVLTIDNSKINYKTDDGNIIFDPENGVLTMLIYDKPDDSFSNERYLKFWSIPSTFKIIKGERTHQIYEFKAKISGTSPRKDKKYTPTITLNCRLEYQI